MQKYTITDIEDDIWTVNIYLNIILGYADGFLGDDHITEIQTLCELMKTHVENVMNKF